MTKNRRAKTPTILQLEATECGAASLGIILGYHGRIVPLADLRHQCGVSRDGSKASNILKAARHYGMLAKGFSKEIKDLQGITPPFIVFWDFNHFVVVEGFGKDTVALNDPASGHRVVSDQEFDRSFTGVVLLMEPGPEFEKGGRKPSVITAITNRLAGSVTAVVYCAIVGFLLVIPGLAVPAFSQIFLDSILLEGHTSWLRPLILAMIVALLMRGALTFLQLHYLRRVKMMLSIKLSSGFMWHALHLPSTFYAQRFAGEVADRSELNDKLADVLSGKLAQTAIDIVMLGFYAALMLFYDVVLASIGIAFATANVLVLRWVSKRRVEANMRILQESGKAQGTAIAGLQSIETIKASGQESGFFGKWSGYYTKATTAGQSLQLSNQVLSVVPTFLSAVMMAMLIIVGGFRIINGHLTIGMLVAFQSLLGSFMSPIMNLLGLGSTFQELQGDLNRVDDILQHPREHSTKQSEIISEDGHKTIRLKGYVELRNVTFGYSPLEQPLLENFSFTIRPGQRVALVGGSGSGKTTVAKLISGEYLPWEGEVLFDGMPRNAIPKNVLANSFATVEQEIILFSGTVRENLTLWDSTVPDHNLIQACEDAVIHEAILGISGGYDGPLLEGGGNLSGGQRQRLEIARALVNNPSILILDEATSALDAETERIVMERLRVRGCSAIIVAHRLSTIRDCDEIIVLEQGTVAERGTHGELREGAGAYARLIRTDPSLAERAH